MKLDDISNLNDDMTYEEVKEEMNKLDPEEKKRIRKNLIIMLILLFIVCIFLIITLFKPVKIKNKKNKKNIVQQETNALARSYVDMVNFKTLSNLDGDVLALFKEDKKLSDEAKKVLFIYNFKKNNKDDCNTPYKASHMNNILKLLDYKLPQSFKYLNNNSEVEVNLKDNSYIKTCHNKANIKSLYQVKAREKNTVIEDDFIYFYQEVLFIKDGNEYLYPEFKNKNINIAGEMKSIYKYTFVKEDNYYQLYEVKKEI